MKRNPPCRGRRSLGRTAGASALALIVLASCSTPAPQEAPTSGTAPPIETAEKSVPSSTSHAGTETSAPSLSATPAPSASTIGRPSETPAPSTNTGSPAATTTALHRTQPTVDPGPATSTTAAAGGVPARTAPESTSPPELFVLDVFAHDPDAFTQGLVFRDGRFYESTGLYGRSSVRIVDPTSGEVLASTPLDSRYFGEGLEVVGERVVQLTWKEETAFVWDARTLDPLGTYSYDGEGWGLCAFADRFVMSDGSSRLTFRHLDTFEVIGSVDVLLAGEPVEDLNELECVGDLVYANVWFSDEIMVIAPDTGQVIVRIDATPLRQRLSATEGIDVLNGIAYDPRRDVFYLTGKLWPDVFEVRIGTSQ